MISNVPDDWNTYYTTCGTCNYRYHMSEYCKCVPCSVEGCSNNTAEDTYCSECQVRLDDMTDSRRIQWKKIHELGYCLNTIMKQAQRRGDYTLADKASKAVYLHIMKE